MRWRSGRRSDNVEDLRAEGPGADAGGDIGGGSGGSRMPVAGAGLGLGGVVIVVVLSLLLHQNPMDVLNQLGAGTDQQAQAPYDQQTVPGQQVAPAPPAGDDTADFVSVVLADTEDTWGSLFTAAGQTYRKPKLVLYSGAVNSACGFSTAAGGPFYCPDDEKVYLDLDFFRDLKKMGAPGDFARAYVVGHEVGHHVQKLLGIMDQVNSAQARSSKANANALSVLLELQADCFAGVWANHADQQRDILDEADVQSGLAAAAAVGDDQLMKSAGRAIRPESFTHGTSAQREKWLLAGIRSGDINGCDTFGAAGN